MAASPSHVEDATADVVTMTLSPGLTPPLKTSGGGQRDAGEPALPSARHIGRYLPLEEIGRGGMGVVVRAYDPRLQREVALKTVRGDALSREAQARLFREAQTMAKLSHPNIVAVYDVAMAGDDVVVAMEYVRGTTLDAWLAVPRDWRDISMMFQAAGRGLAAAHAAGVLHRDFKPTNVVVGDDGRVRVLDFGLAQMRQPAASDRHAAAEEDGLTIAGVVLGTPRFMAPEQHDGGVLDAATDQYAFCVALWEALANQHAFAERDLERLVELKRAGPPAWPRGVPVSAPVRAAVSRGLAADPRQRWPSMDALIDVLTQHTRRSTRPWTIIAPAMVVTATSAFFAHAHREQLAQRCTGAQAALGDAWTPQQRDRVERQLQSFAPARSELGPRMVQHLDAYAAAWIDRHAQTCAATTIRGEQAPEMMDLKMTCLHRARLDLRAVTQLLAQADAQVVDKAHHAVGSLPDLRHCDDEEALEAEVQPPAPANREAVEALRAELSELRVLRQVGKYAEALTRAESLASRAELIPHAPVRAEATLELAISWGHAGHLERAEAAGTQVLRSALMNKQWQIAAVAATLLVQTLGSQQQRPLEALAYAETAHGLLVFAGESGRADLLNEIGGTLQDSGRHTEAEASFRAALDVAERAWGRDHLRTITCRSYLAYNLSMQGRLPEAKRELEQVLRLRQDLLGSENAEVANALYDLGMTLYREGLYAEAEARFRAALETWERTLGAEHLHVALARGKLADTLAARGLAAEAEAEFRAALDAQLKSLGREHPLIAATWIGMATALADLGRFAESEQYMRDALALDEKLSGPRHPHVATSTWLLAKILLRRGQHLKAEVEARRAIAIFEKSPVQPHPEIHLAYHVLAKALKGQGQYHEAERTCRAAIEIAEQLYGRHSIHRAVLLTELGTVLAARGRHEAGEETFREGLAIQVEVHGPAHPQVAIAHGRLGNMLRAQQRHDEAEVMLREALESLLDSRGPEHPDLAALESALGRTLFERGEAKQALRLLERTWASWKDDARVAAPVRAQIAFTLARAVQKVERVRARARALARQARALLEDSSSHAHRRDRVEIDDWLRRNG